MEKEINSDPQLKEDIPTLSSVAEIKEANDSYIIKAEIKDDEVISGAKHAIKIENIQQNNE